MVLADTFQNASASDITFRAAEQALLNTFMTDYRITRTIWILSLVLLVYDWMLTFSDEVRYIWQGRFLWTNILFYWNRYWPIFNLTFDNIVLATLHNTDKKFCNHWMSFLVYAQTPFEISICTVYIMRLYALYGRNRKILAFLCVFYVGVLTSETIIIGVAVHYISFVPLPGPLAGVTGCIPSGVRPWTWTFWLPMLTFETLLLGMSLWKSAWLIFEDRRPRIIYVLLRDSMIYFGGVVLAIITNLVGWKIGGEAFFSTFFPMAIMAFSVLGSRLLLNMHDAVDPIQATYANRSATLTTGDLASLQFKSRNTAERQADSETDIELSHIDATTWTCMIPNDVLSEVKSSLVSKRHT